MEPFDGCLFFLLNATFITAAHFLSLLQARSREKQFLVLGVDQVFKISDQLLGKRVKVVGIANGEASINGFFPVLMKSFKSISSYLTRGSVKLVKDPKKYSVSFNQKKFKLSGNAKTLKISVKTDSVVSGNLIIQNNSKSLRLGISSLLNYFTSKDIHFEGLVTLSSTKEVIENNSKCLVRGILTQGKKGLKVISDHVSSHSDLVIEDLSKRIRFSFYRLCFFASALAMLWTFNNCIKKDFKFFRKPNKLQPVNPQHSNFCVVCFENPSDVLLEPCNHLSICQKCCQFDFCLICRSKVQKFNKVIFVQT